MRISIAIAALLVAAPAVAGDLQPKRERDLPAPRAAEPIQSTDSHSWNGIWGAALAGYGISNSKLNFDGHEVGDVPESSFHGIGGEGFIGQLQAGIDKQLGDRIVAGLFGGASLTNSETTFEVGSTDVVSIEEGNTYFGGARVGYLLNQHNMLYLGGGYFWNVGTEVNFAEAKPGEGIEDFDFEGWFAELGLESRVAENVYARLSGRYYWAGEEPVRLRACPDVDCTGVDVQPDKLEVMAGIVVKFGGFKY